MIQHTKNNTTSRIHQRVQGKEDIKDKEGMEGMEGKEDKDQTLVVACLTPLDETFVGLPASVEAVAALGPTFTLDWLPIAAFEKSEVAAFFPAVAALIPTVLDLPLYHSQHDPLHLH
ncbi:hypothetical protein H5410_045977 [Solanum commersonii]|uniref:Uncharacterized protein n=1 Tax=Solanum commersonii TaxID=4109 RepID=A0A9J5XD65_SOLCO|nr:hypothetical protein H5410_045977 [Solanum commersonii]